MKEAILSRTCRSRRSFKFRPAAVLSLALLSALPLRAQFIVQQVNLTYLTRRADVIVQGKVVRVSHKRLAGYRNIPSVEVTLEVENSLRGPRAKTYTFREAALGLRTMGSKQAYKVGQRVFLFLPNPSRYGLSSPIGIGQGRFQIAGDVKGGARLANGQGNAGLFRNVDIDANKAGKKLTADQKRLAAVKQGSVPLEDFVSLVKDLSTLPRIR
jgi:hypothetical protein